MEKSISAPFLPVSKLAFQAQLFKVKRCMHSFALLSARHTCVSCLYPIFELCFAAPSTQIIFEVNKLDRRRSFQSIGRATRFEVSPLQHQLKLIKDMLKIVIEKNTLPQSRKIEVAERCISVGVPKIRIGRRLVERFPKLML